MVMYRLVRPCSRRLWEPQLRSHQWSIQLWRWSNCLDYLHALLKVKATMAVMSSEFLEDRSWQAWGYQRPLLFCWQDGLPIPFFTMSARHRFQNLLIPTRHAHQALKAVLARRWTQWAAEGRRQRPSSKSGSNVKRWRS